MKLFFIINFKVFESPEKHPRIHVREKEYILATLGSSVMRKGDEKPEIPWKEILTSKPVWIISIAQWGGVWGLFTMITQAPTYFSLIHGWGIEMTGILSGLPHFLRVVFSIVFGNFCDYLLSKKKNNEKQC
jgi:Major Facilitator Superfamily